MLNFKQPEQVSIERLPHLSEFPIRSWLFDIKIGDIVSFFKRKVSHQQQCKLNLIRQNLVTSDSFHKNETLISFEIRKPESQ